MKNLKEIPLGVLLFVVFTYVFVIAYFILIITQVPRSVLFAVSPFSTVMWIDVLLTAIVLFAGTYGFLNGKNWARLFVIFYFGWSAFWDIVMISGGHEVVARVLLFILYVAIIMYLLLSPVRAYFGQTTPLWSLWKKAYTFGEWTLYCREVRLREGKKAGDIYRIYFFSKHPPKSGTPCAMPSGYAVGFNTRSGMPYLKKQ